MPAAWSSTDTAVSLLRDAQTARNRAWIVAYLLSRRGPGPLRPLAAEVAARPTTLSMAGLSQPLHVTPDSGGLATYYEIVTRGIYSREEGLGIASGATVVDVGANVGVFSMFAADAVGAGGAVISIEPHPFAFQVLTRNLAPFACGRQLNIGCGDRSAEMALHYVPGRLSVSSVRPRPDRTESVDMTVRRLDDVLEESGVDSVDLLKIDVEGFENAVLRGADQTLRRTQRMVIETDERGLGEITAFVGERGLRPTGQKNGAWGLAKGRIASFER